MKTILLVIAALITIPAGAQEVATASASTRTAIQVETSLFQDVKYLEARLNDYFKAINSEGEQQANLDAFNTPAALVAWYNGARNLVLSVNPAASIPEIHPAIFVSNPDGSVTYVPEPSPE